MHKQICIKFNQTEKMAKILIGDTLILLNSGTSHWPKLLQLYFVTHGADTNG
jgi:hypothetical protein